MAYNERSCHQRKTSSTRHLDSDIYLRLLLLSRARVSEVAIKGTTGNTELITDVLYRVRLSFIELEGKRERFRINGLTSSPLPSSPSSTLKPCFCPLSQEVPFELRKCRSHLKKELPGWRCGINRHSNTSTVFLD
jgi:hypothetical protein